MKTLKDPSPPLLRSPLLQLFHIRYVRTPTFLMAIRSLEMEGGCSHFRISKCDSDYWVYNGEGLHRFEKDYQFGICAGLVSLFLYTVPKRRLSANFPLNPLRLLFSSILEPFDNISTRISKRVTAATAFVRVAAISGACISARYWRTYIIFLLSLLSWHIWYPAFFPIYGLFALTLRHSKTS